MANVRRRIRIMLLLAVASSVVLSVIWWAKNRKHVDHADDVKVSSGDDRPLASPGNGYVGSQQCRSCHQAEFSSWHTSYHRTMTQVANSTSVLGDFDNVRLELAGIDFVLQRQGDKFWVDMPDPDWDGTGDLAPRVQRQVVQVTGSHHQQVYWYVTGLSRRLAELPFTFLLDEQKWIPEQAAFILPPDTPPFPEPGNWNYSCIRCHSTGPRPNFIWSFDEDPSRQAARVVSTEVSEFGISCEACHGPGEAHVNGHRNPQLAMTQKELELVVPDSLNSAQSSQVCGQCHALWEFKSDDDFTVWSHHGFRFRPGDDFDDSLRWFLLPKSDRPQVRQQLADLPAENVIWSDGMIRVSGREFNGLVESPCYGHGDADRELSCFSCHTMHAKNLGLGDAIDWKNDQLKPGMRTNHACNQCHSEYTDEAKVVAHTHHAADSTGSNCLNCHMSYTTYGLLKAIRGHQINNPSVLESIETGRPNACNQCHLDKTLKWTSGHLRNWYEQTSPDLSAEEQDIAASVLWTLQGDAGQRALMAWSMGWSSAQEASGSNWMIPYLAELMRDPYPAVRIIATRSLRKHLGYEDFEFDAVGTEDTRKLAIEALMKQYAKQSGEVSTERPELLVDSAGQINESQYTRLLNQRDNRPVRLSE